MKKLFLPLVAAVAVAPIALSAQSTITEVTLDDGREEERQISSTLFETTEPLTIGTIQPGFDPGAKIVREGPSGVLGRNPEYRLDKKVKIAALFADALRTEAAAMGHKSSTAGDGWRLDGTLKEVYLESRITFGRTVFYGYMDLELQVRNGSGAAESRRMRFHSRFATHNVGLGRRDEAGEALANLLVEAAQEAVSRLNREFFKSQPRPEIVARLKTLQTSGVSDRLNDLHLVGLSGLPEAPSVLLGLLSQEKATGSRSAIIEALGHLGSPDVIMSLSTRYAKEDEEPRWYTLKAMDYIGTRDAVAFIREQGRKDKDVWPRRLAERIGGD